MNIAIIPVKELSMSKQRLAPVLTPLERRCLSLAMFQDVVTVLKQARNLDRMAVITRDPEVAREAEELDAEVMAEIGFGLNRALSQALELRKARDWTLIYVPADIPCLASDEVERLIEVALEADVVVVPDARRGGTNALALRSPHEIRFRFEGESLGAHLEEAQRQGWKAELLRLESFAWDVDLPSDLSALRRKGPHTRAFQYLTTTAAGAVL